MLGRQKVLLSLISALEGAGKPITKTYLDKALFLLKMEYNIGDSVKFYNFYPHKYGPFSNNYYADLNALQSRGLIDEGLNIKEKGGHGAMPAITDLIGRFQGDNEIVDYVYGKYPQYTIRSVLKAGKAEAHPPQVFSIGYEKKDIDSFLDILIRNYVEIVVDVRANPFSMNFAFTKEKLRRSLESASIGYLHMPELGIEGKMRQKLESRQDYDRLFSHYSENILPKNMDAARKIAALGAQKRIALLCFEADHEFCHRGVLSGRIEEITGKKVGHL